jgi:hypothetical protein
MRLQKNGHIGLVNVQYRVPQGRVGPTYQWAPTLAIGAPIKWAPTLAMGAPIKWAPTLNKMGVGTRFIASHGAGWGTHQHAMQSA